jgi:hypothetical protein
MRPPSPRLLSLAAALLVLQACQDSPTGNAAAGGRARLAIQDGSHNSGNAHFYWGAPIVSIPGRGGTFDPTFQPEVQVCEWDGTACGTVVAEFRRRRGTGGSYLRVDAAGELYHVNWNTGQCRTGPCVLDPARTYRIRVLVGGLEAGFADVDVVTNQKQLRNVNTGEYIPLVDGTTLQIRFRLEQGLTLRSADATLPSGWHPVSGRYRDSGIRPGRGRDGSAEVQGRALLGRDGTTVFELTTGQLDGGGAPGNIERVQFKQLSADGSSTLTMNFNGLQGGGTWSRSTEAFPRHAQVQLQANISGIDAERTDVVTVPLTVARRPDLEVSSLSAPDEALPGAVVPIHAAIRERNGDVGATGNCRLYIDGTVAEQADGIWVDAGDEVGCQFAHAFPEPGTYVIRTAIESVVPGDDDPANNARTDTITVRLPGSATNVYGWYYADMEDQEFEHYWTSFNETTRSDDPDYIDRSEQWDAYQAGRIRRMAFSQSWNSPVDTAIDNEISFPVPYVRLRHANGASAAADFVLTNLASDWTGSWTWSDGSGNGYSAHQSCGSAAAPNGQSGSITVCSYASTQWNPSTPAQIYRFTFGYASSSRGRYLYSGHASFRQLYSPSGLDTAGVHVWGYDSSTGAEIDVPLGNRLGIDLEVRGTSASGGEPRSFVVNVAGAYGAAENQGGWYTEGVYDGQEYCGEGRYSWDVYLQVWHSCWRTTGYYRVGYAEAWHAPGM